MKGNDTVLIMGLGLHGGGIGAANYFLSRGSRVIITDLKSEKELRKSIEKLKSRKNVRFVLGRHDFEDFHNVDLIIKNPAVPLDSPYIKHALDHGVRVDTDIGIFIDNISEKTRNIIGVTGTKGKSTTAALLHRIIIRKHPGALLGGNITVSVFDILDHVKSGSYVILELSSFQLGGIRERGYSPRLGIITNFMEDHLNYYKSMEDYFQDKAVLYMFQKEGDVLVINRDDPVFSLIKIQAGVKLTGFGFEGGFTGEGSFIRDGKIYFRGDEKTDFIIDTAEIKLPGKHNLYNVLAAVAAACVEGVKPPEIERAISNFHGLEHRLEYVGSYNNTAFYNDSAATIPAAAVQAIECFNGSLTMIAGGSDKGLDLEAFITKINERVNNLLLLEGTGTDRLLQEGLKGKYKVFSSLKEALGHVFRMRKSSDIVLLSPGFASFGMFFNEFHRGEEFKNLFFELTGGGEYYENGKEL